VDNAKRRLYSFLGNNRVVGASVKITSQIEDHVGYWLRYVSNHVSHAFSQRVEAQGVTVAEWVLLREMLNTGAVNPSYLAAKIGLTRGAVSKLVERLLKKNLVVRSHSENDRRYQTIDLSPSGKQIIPVLGRLADENDHEFFGHLTPDEKTSLLNLLQEIVRRNGWKNLPVD
jgi:DNA-binding MarR family transcriptional regulator